MKGTISLTAREHMELQQQAHSFNGQGDSARRARLILLLAEGRTWTDIRATLDCSDSYISRWRKRFEAGRLTGLLGRHAGRQRYKLTDQLESRVLEWTISRKPEDGAEYWSSRKLADELGDGISHMAVSRIWAKHGLTPHQLKGHITSNDAHPGADVVDIIGLYLNPPQHAAAFLVNDSSTGFSSGAQSLLSALKATSEQAISKAPERHTSAEYVAFLTDIVVNQAAGRDIDVIADTPPVHNSKRVKGFLAAHPNVHLHFASTYLSWLSLVERWLTKVEGDVSARGLVMSDPDLKKELMRHIRRYNADTRPVKWRCVHTSQRITSD